MELDRLSPLNDLLLEDILERLPFQEAVAGMILARRFKDIFFQMNRMKIDLRLEAWENSQDAKIESFLNFLERMLLRGSIFKRGPPNLNNLAIVCSGGVNWNTRIYFVLESWIGFSIKSDKIKHLSLSLSLDSLIGIPDQVFSLENLRSLKVDSYVFIKKDILFSLPRVNEVSLKNAVFESESTIEVMTKACPALKFLTLHVDFDLMLHMPGVSVEDRRNKVSYDVMIQSRELERFELALSDYNIRSRTCYIRLEAPKIQCLNLITDDMYMRDRMVFVGEIPCVKLDAAIGLNGMRMRNESLESEGAFVKGLDILNSMHTECLLIGRSAFELIRSCRQMNTLAKITTLEVSMDSDLGTTLWQVVKRMPELRYVTINLVPKEEGDLWPRGGASPPAGRSFKKVERCWVTEYTGAIGMFDLLKFLLANSGALQEFSVYVRGSMAEIISNLRQELEGCERLSPCCALHII